MVGQLGSRAWQPVLPLLTGEAGAALALSWLYLQLPSYGQACRPPSMLAFPSLHTSEVLSSYPLPPGLSPTADSPGGVWVHLNGEPSEGDFLEQAFPTLAQVPPGALSFSQPEHLAGLPCQSAVHGPLFPQPARKLHQPGGSPGSGSGSPHQQHPEEPGVREGGRLCFLRLFMPPRASLTQSWESMADPWRPPPLCEKDLVGGGTGRPAARWQP